MSETFQHGELKLEVKDTTVTLTGRSTARDPGNFIGPILTNLYKQASAAGKAMILDFRKLDYMNSSTITPVIRLLHEAKKSGGKVTITYDGKSRWQDLSFSALTIFATEDKRIEIRGE
ncbi:MAG: SiaC family regulatory phosphoprotein [Deltaproteobacteria bacterium]|nr:SiaC family regulatory phosphoprotein [Deltaproteobacteria bacterium]